MLHPPLFKRGGWQWGHASTGGVVRCQADEPMLVVCAYAVGAVGAQAHTQSQIQLPALLFLCFCSLRVSFRLNDILSTAHPRWVFGGKAG